jgi:hypothetical protein
VERVAVSKQRQEGWTGERIPKEHQRTGRAANSAKRSPEELQVGVHEWVEKKFRLPEKHELMDKLWPGHRTSEWVLNIVG